MKQQLESLVSYWVILDQPRRVYQTTVASSSFVCWPLQVQPAISSNEWIGSCAFKKRALSLVVTTVTDLTMQLGTDLDCCLRSLVCGRSDERRFVRCGGWCWWRRHDGRGLLGCCLRFAVILLHVAHNRLFTISCNKRHSKCITNGRHSFLTTIHHTLKPRRAVLTRSSGFRVEVVVLFYQCTQIQLRIDSHLR